MRLKGMRLMLGARRRAAVAAALSGVALYLLQGVLGEAVTGKEFHWQ